MKLNLSIVHERFKWPRTPGPRSVDIAMGSMRSPEATYLKGRPAFVQNLERYKKYQSEEKRNSKNHVRAVERENLKMYDSLDAAGMETHPLKMGRKEIYYLHDQIPLGKGGSARNRMYRMDLLYGFLRWVGNENLPKMIWPKSTRPNADWLTEEAMETIRLSVENNPELALMHHLAGDYGFRRVEILRAEVQDFDGPKVLVRGKGKGPDGYKPRWLLQHPDTDFYLPNYLEYRDKIIRRARLENPLLEEPRGLFAYHRGNRLDTYKNTALDTRISIMRNLSGIYFKGFHTLRRSCARQWWANNAPIETISDMLGHESIDQTIRYLGINQQDHALAFNLRRERQQQIREEIRVKTLNPPTKTDSVGDWM